MNIAIKLLIFFIGMGLSMVGIMIALSSQQHMVLGVLLLTGGIVTMWGSLPSYE